MTEKIVTLFGGGIAIADSDNRTFELRGVNDETTGLIQQVIKTEKEFLTCPR